MATDLALSTQHPAPALERALKRRRGVVGRTMFGCRAWFVGGKMFAVEWRGNPVLRLAEADRAKACAELGAKPWSPGRGTMKEYVEFPAANLREGSDLKVWLDRALKYARSLSRKVKPARNTR